MLALYARKLVAYVWVALQKVVVTYSNKKELLKESNAEHFLSHVFAFEFSLGILKSVHSTMKHFMFWIVERPILFFFAKPYVYLCCLSNSSLISWKMEDMHFHFNPLMLLSLFKCILLFQPTH